MLIAAVKKRHAGGQAVGIDIWRQEDLMENSFDALASNAAAEGVDNKVSFMTGDARTLSFPDGSFDIMLSLYCIYNIDDNAEQRQACSEIARVLKPGGRALADEYLPTHAYADAFWEAGLTVAFLCRFFGVALGPMRMVDAARPLARNS